MSDRLPFSLARLAELTSTSVDGDHTLQISGVAPITDAGPGSITFLSNPAYRKHLETCRASAIVLDPVTERGALTALRSNDPYRTFAELLDLFYPTTPVVSEGIAPTAVCEPGSNISPTAAIGHLSHVRIGATIGDRTQLVSGVFVGRDVHIGADCLIYPGVAIMDGCRIGDRVIIHASTVIGSDGFGFVPGKSGHKKIKQVGWVEIGDDVEIGSNVSIDRGATGPTRIGRGTKIDNLVMIAHNVEVGAHCFLVAQAGIAGSTRLGNFVTLAGQVGVVGHLDIGDGVRVAAQSGVMHNIPPGETWMGSPAREIMRQKRREAATNRLETLLKRVARLEQKLGLKKGQE